MNYTWQSLAILLWVAAFTAWCLWGVNWQRGWPVLAAGGWLPLVLIAGLTAYAWSKVSPEPLPLGGGMAISNLAWKLGVAGLLVGDLLFCGWLQTRLGWTPAEVSFEPPVTGTDHGHH